MKELETLHPAAQVTALIVLGVIACIGIWQFWKTIKED